MMRVIRSGREIPGIMIRDASQTRTTKSADRAEALTGRNGSETP